MGVLSRSWSYCKKQVGGERSLPELLQVLLATEMLKSLHEETPDYVIKVQWQQPHKHSPFINESCFVFYSGKSH